MGPGDKEHNVTPHSSSHRCRWIGGARERAHTRERVVEVLLYTYKMRLDDIQALLRRTGLLCEHLLLTSPTVEHVAHTLWGEQMRFAAQRTPSVPPAEDSPCASSPLS